jgi:hypothetical protein
MCACGILYCLIILFLLKHIKPNRRATRTPSRNFRSELVRRFINIRGIIDHNQLNFLFIANYGIVIAFGLVYIVRYYTPIMELISCDIIEIPRILIKRRTSSDLKFREGVRVALLFGFMCCVLLVFVFVVREKRTGNQEWTIQRYWQYLGAQDI